MRTDSIEMVAVLVTPPAVAVRMALVEPVTDPAVAVNVVADAPAGTDADAGTASAPALLVNETAKPPAGAGLVNPSVQLTFPPGLTAARLHESVDKTGGTDTLKVPATQVPLSSAMTVALESAAAAPAVASKLPEMLPAGTTTVAGTVTAPDALRATVAPAAGTVAESVTAQALDAPGLSVCGLQLTSATARRGSIITAAVRSTLPALAVIVIGVETATAPAVTLKLTLAAP
jgi:hypothetical protein